jgi:uncharacterized protein (DUF3084 family)
MALFPQIVLVMGGIYAEVIDHLGDRVTILFLAWGLFPFFITKV